MEVFFRDGDVEEAISIMREAAQGLIDDGRAMWALEDLTPQALPNKPEDYLVIIDGEGRGLAALTLTFVDPIYWPEIAPGESGYLHKIAVRREYRGKGLVGMLVKHAAEICRQKGVYTLRLDCDTDRSGLPRLYESLGFVLQAKRKYPSKVEGQVEVSLYKLELGPQE